MMFEIDEFELKDDRILVSISKNNEQQTVAIPRAKYEEWLKDSSRLDWVYDTVTCDGEHDQQTGTLPIDIYFEDIPHNDLYDWIVLKWVAEDVFNIQQPMENILGSNFYNSLKEAV